MKKKSIALDLDTTLNNLDTVILERYNKDYNDTMTIKDLSVWETHTLVKPECGLKVWDYLKEESFFLNLGIQPYAQEVTKFLAEHYELHIATAYNDANPYEKIEKRAWIEKYFPHIPVENINFINNKGVLEMDYLIDDGPHNIIAFKQTPIIINTAYNQHLGNDYFRAFNFLDIKYYFEEAIKKDYNIVNI